jgi:tetratricopeptide (TPR) repeat protein
MPAHPAPVPAWTIERCYASAYAALEADDLQSAGYLFGIMAVLAPGDARAWIGLAIANEQRAPSMALGLYRLAASLAPDPAACHQARGRLLERLGRHAEASAAFEAALDGDTSPALARRGRASLVKAQLV